MSIAYNQEVQLRISTSAEGGQELDRLTSKMEGLEKELGAVGKAAKESNAAQLEAANKLNDARAKQDQIKRTLNETNEAYKALMDQVRKGGEGQQKYAAEAAATRQRMDQLRTSLNEAGKDVFRLNDEYKRTAAQSRFLAAEQRRVSGDLKETGAAADRVRQRLRELRNSTKESASAFDGMRGKIASVIAAIGGFIGIKRGFDSITGSAETLDVGMRKVEATIQATGGAAGLTAAEIGDMAKRLDEATLGSAEGFRNAAAKLLTFKSISKDAFETTLKLAQDLAATGFGSLETNVVQLGKALENPKQGISALAEAGVTFTDQQKTLITYLVETGKQAQAQGVILEAVAGQVAGVASAVGQGMSGAADLAGKRFTDFKELLGKGLVPVLADLYNRVADLFKQMNESGAVERLGAVFATVFKGAGESFLRFVAQVDLDALSARMATWADQSGAAVARWVGYVESAGDSVKLVYGAIATGGNVVLAGIYKWGQAFSWVAGNIQSGLALILDGMSKVTFGDLSARFKSYADEVRLSAEATWSVSEAYADEASAAFGRAADSAETFRAAWTDLTEAAEPAAEAVTKIASAASLSAAEVAALGDDTEFVNGELRKVQASGTAAAAGIDKVSDAAKAAAAEQMQLVEKTLAVETAFQKLGITSSATLKKQADEAKAAYDTIKNSGMATSRDLQQAFEAYAQRAIAANGGVASSSLQIEAAMAGVKLETEKTAEAAKKAAAGFKEVADEAKGASSAVDDLAAARDAASRGEVRASSVIFDTKQSAIAAGVDQDNVDAVASRIEFLLTKSTASNRGKLPSDVEYEAVVRQAIRDVATAETSKSTVSTRNNTAQPAVQVSTFRVDLSFNGGKTTSVNVQSKKDAESVNAFFKEIETAMGSAKG